MSESDLSYVIVTHNRRDRLLETLAELQRVTPLPPNRWETWVVDNGSTDGTARAVRDRFPDARVIVRLRNEGAGARSHAFEPARGRYLCLLDDDSYPTPGAIDDSIRHLDQTQRCGAVVGRCLLPDGTAEACAFPSVMLSGAVVLRKEVVAEIGGFGPEFFRKAGEYDYSFRALRAGWSVERFEDIVYRHDKVNSGRSSSLAHFMDLRNNLILCERFFPREHRRVYREDFTQRYTALARHAGQLPAARQAVAAAMLWRLREAGRGRQLLDPRSLETVLEWNRQHATIARWSAREQITRVILADFSKNLHASWRGCIAAGVTPIAIADDHPAFAGMAYRGVPVLPVSQAAAMRADGVILSNVNPAQVEPRAANLGTQIPLPLLKLWEPRYLSTPAAQRQAA